MSTDDKKTTTSVADSNLISLKEAAELSGYSADYIGQLIRSGKIFGKQVYTNIAWMTSAEEVMNYKNKKNDSQNKNTKKQKTSIKEYLIEQKRKLALELSIFKVFLQNSRSALPVLIVLILSFLCLNAAIFYFYFNQQTAKAETEIYQKQNNLTY